MIVVIRVNPGKNNKNGIDNTACNTGIDKKLTTVKKRTVITKIPISIFKRDNFIHLDLPAGAEYLHLFDILLLMKRNGYT